MRMIILTTLTALLLAVSPVSSQEVQDGVLNADDFITEAQGGSTTVESPAEVTVEQDVLTAATMQDAAIKTEEVIVDEYIEDEPAFKLITSKKGGVGAIAMGRATYYSDAKNRDAIRLAMRHAYVKAFMEAKKNLALGMNGLSSHGQTVLNEVMTTLVQDDETLKNKGTDIEEMITQRIDGFIRGYEIRAVKNVPEESMIYVTISVNGKTLGRHSRPVPAVIEAIDIKTGLNQAFDEIRNGIALMAGGRVIITENDVCYTEAVWKFLLIGLRKCVKLCSSTWNESGIAHG